MIKGESYAKSQIAMVKTYFYDSASIIEKSGKDALNSFAEGDELRMMMLGLKRFTKTEAFNPKEARQIIANELIASNSYCF